MDQFIQGHVNQDEKFGLHHKTNGKCLKGLKRQMIVFTFLKNQYDCKMKNLLERCQIEGRE